MLLLNMITIQEGQYFQILVITWVEQIYKGFVVKEYIRGYVDNTFKPKISMTIAESVVMLNKVSKQ